MAQANNGKNQLVQEKIIIAAVIISVAAILISFMTLPGWTWSFLDDLFQAGNLSKALHVVPYSVEDFILTSRLRVTTTVINDLKFILFGFHPQVIRCSQVVLLLSALGLAYLYMRRINKLPLWPTVFTCLMILKARPFLDQFQNSFSGEVPGLFLFILALILWKRTKALSYVCLFLMVFCKEPFWLFVPIPWVLEKRWRMSVVMTAVSGAVMVFLFLNRHGVTASYATTTAFLGRITFRFLIDSFPIYFLILALKVIYRQIVVPWKALVFFAFGFAYFLLLLPQAYEYGYYFAPSVMLMNMGLAFLLSENENNLDGNKFILNSAAIIAMICVPRVGQFIVRFYGEMAANTRLFEFVETLPREARISMNCRQDNHGIGFAADLIRNGTPDGARPDGTSSCQSYKECCSHETHMAIGLFCDGVDQLRKEALDKNLKIIYSSKRWLLLNCN